MLFLLITLLSFLFNPAQSQSGALDIQVPLGVVQTYSITVFFTGTGTSTSDNLVFQFPTSGLGRVTPIGGNYTAATNGAVYSNCTGCAYQGMGAVLADSNADGVVDRATFVMAEGSFLVSAVGGRVGFVVYYVAPAGVPGNVDRATGTPFRIYLTSGATTSTYTMWVTEPLLSVQMAISSSAVDARDAVTGTVTVSASSSPSQLTLPVDTNVTLSPTMVNVTATTPAGALQPDGSVLVRLSALGAGQSATVTFSGTVQDAAGFGAYPYMQARLAYRSASLDASAYGREYLKTAQANWTLAAPAADLGTSLTVRTSDPWTTASCFGSATLADVAFGEVVTVNGSVALREGVSNLFISLDSPGAAASRAAYIPGSAVITRIGSRISGAAGVMPAVGQVASGASFPLNWTFGTVLNSPADNQATADDNIEFTFQFSLPSTASRGDTTSVSLTASASGSGSSSLASPAASVSVDAVVAPLLTWSLTPNVSACDAGDPVLYTLRATHAASSCAAAWNFTLGSLALAGAATAFLPAGPFLLLPPVPTASAVLVPPASAASSDPNVFASGTAWSFEGVCNAVAPAVSQLQQHFSADRVSTLTSASTATPVGAAVALSADAQAAISGDPYDGGRGSVTIWTRSALGDPGGGIWARQVSQFRPASMTTLAGQLLGASVSLSSDGSIAAVGAPNDGFGAVYLLSRSSTLPAAAWSWLSSSLVGAEASTSSGTAFGSSVALRADGLLLVAGGPGYLGGVGAVWVFSRADSASTTWSQRGAPLSGAGALGLSLLGSSLALSTAGDLLVVGGPGDSSSAGALWVYVCRNPATPTKVTFAQLQRLVHPTSSGLLGAAVALSADGSAIAATVAGGVALFDRTDGLAFAAQAAPVATATSAASVALSGSGSLLLVGLPGAAGAASGPGGALVVNRLASHPSWTSASAVTSNLTLSSDTSRMGVSVALAPSGAFAALGAPGPSASSGSGAVRIATAASYDFSIFANATAAWSSAPRPAGAASSASVLSSTAVAISRNATLLSCVQSPAASVPVGVPVNLKCAVSLSEGQTELSARFGFAFLAGVGHSASYSLGANWVSLGARLSPLGGSLSGASSGMLPATVIVNAFDNIALSGADTATFSVSVLILDRAATVDVTGNPVTLGSLSVVANGALLWRTLQVTAVSPSLALSLSAPTSISFTAFGSGGATFNVTLAHAPGGTSTASAVNVRTAISLSGLGVLVLASPSCTGGASAVLSQDGLGASLTAASLPLGASALCTFSLLVPSGTAVAAGTAVTISSTTTTFFSEGYDAASAVVAMTAPAATPATVLINLVGPRLVNCTASDPAEQTFGYGAADTITLAFDIPTSTPPIATKAQVDALLTYLTPTGGFWSPGVDYSGAWVSATVAVITIVTPSTVSPPALGDMSTFALRAGVLKDSTGLSLFSAVSSPPLRLDGNWGLKPRVLSVAAATGSSGFVPGSRATLSIAVAVPQTSSTAAGASPLSVSLSLSSAPHPSAGTFPLSVIPGTARLASIAPVAVQGAASKVSFPSSASTTAILEVTDLVVFAFTSQSALVFECDVVVDGPAWQSLITSSPPFPAGLSFAVSVMTSSTATSRLPLPLTSPDFPFSAAILRPQVPAPAIAAVPAGSYDAGDQVTVELQVDHSGALASSSAYSLSLTVSLNSTWLALSVPAGATVTGSRILEGYVSLLLRWNFDWIVGLAADTSGNSRDGVNVGATVGFAASSGSRVGLALFSSTLSSQLTITNFPALESADGSLSFWFLSRSLPGSPSAAPACLVGSTGVSVQLHETYLVANSLYASASLLDGAWHHVVFTYSSAAGTSLYLDGLEVGSDRSGEVDWSSPSGADVLLGGGCPGSRFFDGEMDDLRWYSIALSSDSVARIYAGFEGVRQVPWDSALSTASTGVLQLTSGASSLELGQNVRVSFTVTLTNEVGTATPVITDAVRASVSYSTSYQPRACLGNRVYSRAASSASLSDWMLHSTSNGVSLVTDPSGALVDRVSPLADGFVGGLAPGSTGPWGPALLNLAVVAPLVTTTSTTAVRRRGCDWLDGSGTTVLPSTLTALGSSLADRVELTLRNPFSFATAAAQLSSASPVPSSATVPVDSTVSRSCAAQPGSPAYFTLGSVVNVVCELTLREGKISPGALVGTAGSGAEALGAAITSLGSRVSSISSGAPGAPGAAAVMSSGASTMTFAPGVYLNQWDNLVDAGDRVTLTFRVRLTSRAAVLGSAVPVLTFSLPSSSGLSDLVVSVPYGEPVLSLTLSAPPSLVAGRGVPATDLLTFAIATQQPTTAPTQIDAYDISVAAVLVPSPVVTSPAILPALTLASLPYSVASPSTSSFGVSVPYVLPTAAINPATVTAELRWYGAPASERGPNTPAFSLAVPASVVIAINSPGPSIVSCVGADPLNSLAGWSAGDTITVTFNEPTNKPSVGSKAAVDSVLTLSPSSQTLGTDYTGSWSADGLVLTIVSVDPTQAQPSAGPPVPWTTQVVIRGASGGAPLRGASGASLPSDAAAVITGDFGYPAGPVLLSVVASDPKLVAEGVNAGDLLTVTFSVNATSVITPFLFASAFNLTVASTGALVPGITWGALTWDSSGRVLTAPVAAAASSASAVPASALRLAMASPANGIQVAGIMTRNATGDVAVTGEWGWPAVPKIIQLVASDPDNLDGVLSSGDVLTVVFDQDTNRPPEGDAQALSSWIRFGAPDLFLTAPSVSGTWLSSKVLAITVLTNVTASAAVSFPAPSASFSATVIGSALNTPAGTAKSQPAAPFTPLSGNWGTLEGPAITSIVAAGGPLADAVPSSGDTVLVTFSIPTNRPAVLTLADIAQVVRFVPSDLQSAAVLEASGVWRDSSTLLITLSKVNSSLPFPLAIGSTAAMLGPSVRDAELRLRPWSGVSPALSGSWGLARGPEIVAVVCSDPDNGDAIFSAGDRVDIVLSRASGNFTFAEEYPDGPSVASLFAFSPPAVSQAASLSGRWVSPTTFRIEIGGPVNASVAVPAPGAFTVSTTRALSDREGLTLTVPRSTLVSSGDWGLARGPSLVRAACSADPADSDALFGPGDQLTLNFSAPVAAYVPGSTRLSKTAVDSMLSLPPPLRAWATSYEAVWSSPSSLTVTFLATAPPPTTPLGQPCEGNVTFLQPVLGASGDTLPSLNVTAGLQGSWGAAQGPKIIRLVAVPASGARAFGPGAAIVAHFDEPTNLWANLSRGAAFAKSLVATEPLDFDFRVEWAPNATALKIIVVPAAVAAAAAATGRANGLPPTAITPPTIGVFRLALNSNTSVATASGGKLPYLGLSPPLEGSWVDPLELAGGTSNIGGVGSLGIAVVRCNTFWCRLAWLLLVALAVTVAGVALLVLFFRRRRHIEASTLLPVWADEEQEMVLLRKAGLPALTAERNRRWGVVGEQEKVEKKEEKEEEEEKEEVPAPALAVMERLPAVAARKAALPALSLGRKQPKPAVTLSDEAPALPPPPPSDSSAVPSMIAALPTLRPKPIKLASPSPEGGAAPLFESAFDPFAKPRLPALGSPMTSRAGAEWGWESRGKAEDNDKDAKTSVGDFEIKNRFGPDQEQREQEDLAPVTTSKFRSAEASQSEHVYLPGLVAEPEEPKPATPRPAKPAKPQKPLQKQQQQQQQQEEVDRQPSPRPGVPSRSPRKGSTAQRPDHATRKVDAVLSGEVWIPEVKDQGPGAIEEVGSQDAPATPATPKRKKATKDKKPKRPPPTIAPETEVTPPQKPPRFSRKESSAAILNMTAHLSKGKK